MSEGNDFNAGIEASIKDGKEKVTLRPDVEPILINRDGVEAHRLTFQVIANMILSRLAKAGAERAAVGLTDGFPFTLLIGCLRCGYVIHEQNDHTDTCSHCEQGVHSDLYVSKRKAYILALVGSLLNFWKLWPPVADEALWEADRKAGAQASFPLLTK